MWKSRRIWAKWGSYLHIQTWEFDFYLDSFLISFQARALEKMLFLIQNIWLPLNILTLGVMGIVKPRFALYFRIKSPLLDFNCHLIAKSCPMFCNPMVCSSPGFSVHRVMSRQAYWHGLPFPSAWDLPRPGTEPTSSTLAGGFFTTELPGRPLISVGHVICCRKMASAIHTNNTHFSRRFHFCL